MTRNQQTPSIAKITTTGLLAWLVPGLGHIVCGDRQRGLIILVTITVTFWGGVAIGGVRTTVDPQRQKLWFMAQICSGGNAIAAASWGESARNEVNNDDSALAHSHWGSTEVALVYTGVAGLLNVLAVMNSLMHTAPIVVQSRPPVRQNPNRSGVT